MRNLLISMQTQIAIEIARDAFTRSHACGANVERSCGLDYDRSLRDFARVRQSHVIPRGRFEDAGRAREERA